MLMGDRRIRDGCCEKFSLEMKKEVVVAGKVGGAAGRGGG